MNTETQTMLLTESVSIARYNADGIINLSPATIRWFRAAVDSLVRFGGDKSVRDVSPQYLDEWQHHEVGRGLAPNSANNYLRAIRVIYNRLIRSGHLEQNPAIAVDYWPETTPARRVINKETYNSLLSVANVRDKAMFATLWSTGCRLAGLASMTIDKKRMNHWQDKGHCFAIKVDEKGKHGRIKQRWVYIKNEEQNEGDLFWEWLQARPKSRNSHIFLTSTKPTRSLSKITIQSTLRNLAHRANIPSGSATNAHAFRHAFATRKLEEGYDLAVVSAWLGHEDPEFTAQVYARRSESELRRIYFK